MRRARVVADDFGASAGRNAGIAQAIRHGMVDAASLLVNAPAASDAARTAKAAKWCVGLHLNLTEYTPVNRSLGPACFAGARKLWTNTAPIAGLRAEIEAQIALFKELVGRTPDYLDGHHHCHVVPTVAPEVARAVATHGIARVRQPRAASPPCCSTCALAHAAATPKTAGVFGGGDHCEKPYTAAELAALVQSCDEVMVHPGVPDATDTPFGAAANRQVELDTLLACRCDRCKGWCQRPTSRQPELPDTAGALAVHASLVAAAARGRVQPAQRPNKLAKYFK